MKIKTVLLIIFAYSLVKFWSFYSEGKNLNKLTFFDIGQGDAILISSKDRGKMLIDGGPDYKLSTLLTDEFIYNNCALDYVLLTHPHADHLKGLTRVVNNCKIDTVLFNKVTYDSELYKDFVRKFIDKDYLGVSTRDIYKLGQFNLHIFWPDKSFLSNTAAIKNVNNVSIVLLLDYGKFEALFTGDLEKEYLAKLDYAKMQELIQGDLEVLKVPHHGSIDSLDKNLYINLHPKICVISVGYNNKYGHPDKAVIDYLEKIKCEIKRTDLEGTIEILMD